MPSYSRQIKVPGKSSQELYDTVSTQIEQFLGKITPTGKFEIERDEIKKEFRVKAPLFSGTLACQNSSIELIAQLSLMALPFRSKLDEGIDRWVAKLFRRETLS